ncbi:MAG: selenium metabolism-associated LysR family transcriptional regulator [Desulfovermiculus sp.]
MDIRRLETFCAVFEHQSFSKAGECLYLAQPTISSHIASLEKELGTSLFDRFARQVVPTQAGQTLYRYAQEMIQARQNASAEISLLMNKVSGRIRLGGSSIPGHFILPRYMGLFCSKFPDVHVSLEIGDTQGIERMVQEGIIDVGVIGGREDILHLTYHEIARDELLLLCSSHSFWNHRGNENLVPEAHWPWIIREPGSGTRKAMFSFLQSIGIAFDHMNIRATVSSTQAVLACIQSGLGVSMVSSLAAREYLGRKEITQVPVRGPNPSRDFYAVVHDQRAQLPVTKAFLQELGFWESKDSCTFYK